ncbi:MAG: ABC transporter ATP-binding protein [Bacillota bacterium]
MNAVMIDLVGVTKAFGETEAVRNLHLQVMKGEFLTLLGPSGCGKTTTLRMIAGFEQPNEGTILLDGQPVAGLPPYRRDVNTVFQSYALFPHMTVFENVAFGLSLKRVPRDEVHRRVTEALDMVQLAGLEGRRPRQLSGGQQQRVAVARAIVNRPKVLLLDEPLGALDLKLRKQMQVELKHLQQRLGITFIYVTHDQEEALTMSDRIAVMNGGVIEQLGTCEEVYHRPRTRFVADFIGETNLFTGRVQSRIPQALVLEADGLRLTAPPAEAVEGAEVYLSVRPEKIRVQAGSATAGADASGEVAATATGTRAAWNHVAGRLTDKVFAGAATRLLVEVAGGQRVTVQTQDPGLATGLAVGSPVTLSWRPEDSAVMTA